MSDFFSDALNNADQLEQELLGPDYEYYKFVKTPAQIGMSNKAKDLITDFKGIITSTTSYCIISTTTK